MPVVVARGAWWHAVFLLWGPTLEEGKGQMRITNTFGIAGAGLIAVAAIAGCNNNGNRSATDSAAGSIGYDTTNGRVMAHDSLSDTLPRDTTMQHGMATSDTGSKSALQVADVTVGKAIDTQKKVTDEEDTFAPREPIYVSVHTNGAAKDAKLVMRVNAEDGKVVTEKSQMISPTGDMYSEFHVSKKGGLKPGKYTVHVTVNGQEAATQTKDFTVKAAGQ